MACFPAVDKAVPQVWRAVGSVAQVPLTVDQPRVFINGEPLSNVPENAVTVPGKIPGEVVTANPQVPSVVIVLMFCLLYA